MLTYLLCVKHFVPRKMPKYIAFAIMKNIINESFKYGKEPMAGFCRYQQLIGCAAVGNIDCLGELEPHEKRIIARNTLNLKVIKQVEPDIDYTKVAKNACKNRALDLFKYCFESGQINPSFLLFYSVEKRNMEVYRYLISQGVVAFCNGGEFDQRFLYPARVINCVFKSNNFEIIKNYLDSLHDHERLDILHNFSPYMGCPKKLLEKINNLYGFSFNSIGTYSGNITYNYKLDKILALLYHRLPGAEKLLKTMNHDSIQEFKKITPYHFDLVSKFHFTYAYRAVTNHESFITLLSFYKRSLKPRGVEDLFYHSSDELLIKLFHQSQFWLLFTKLSIKHSRFELFKYFSVKMQFKFANEKNLATHIFLKGSTLYLKFLLENAQLDQETLERFAHLAIDGYHLKMFELVFEHCCKFKKTLFKYAANTGNLLIIKFLVEKGCNYSTEVLGLITKKTKCKQVADYLQNLK